MFIRYKIDIEQGNGNWLVGFSFIIFILLLANFFLICFILFQGKNESLRARAILRSLVPLEDLQGVLSLRFTLHNPAAGEERPKSDMPSGLIPGHKQSVVLFLERVYGIETQELFYKLLEEAILPDLRCATMLDRVSFW